MIWAVAIEQKVLKLVKEKNKCMCLIIDIKLNNLKTNMICDMIKGNESDVGNIEFELQA